MTRRDPDSLILGAGCFVFLLWAAFWIAIIAVAAHFIAKYW